MVYRRFPGFVLSTCISLAVFSSVGCDEMAKQAEAEAYKQAIVRVYHDLNLVGNEATDDHMARMHSIDLSGCPGDFRLSYAHYMDAWGERVAVHKAAVKNSDDALPSAGAELLARAFGVDSAQPWQEHQQAASQIEAYSNRAESDLTVTANEMNDLAIKYGVSLH